MKKKLKLILFLILIIPAFIWGLISESFSESDKGQVEWPTESVIIVVPYSYLRCTPVQDGPILCYVPLGKGYFCKETRRITWYTADDLQIEQGRGLKDKESTDEQKRRKGIP